jgi:hypothetical protein
LVQVLFSTAVYGPLGVESVSGSRGLPPKRVYQRDNAREELTTLQRRGYSMVMQPGIPLEFYDKLRAAVDSQVALGPVPGKFAEVTITYAIGREAWEAGVAKVNVTRTWRLEDLQTIVTEQGSRVAR